MILITGAYGFIGSQVAHHYLSQGYPVIAVDDFSRSEKSMNLPLIEGSIKVERAQLWDWLNAQEEEIHLIIHLGARTDTTTHDVDLLNHLNLNYSQKIWKVAAQRNIPLIYASSAATYGDGALGFEDDHDVIPHLRPLNAYGWSKQDFDTWTFAQAEKPPRFYGLKFFNVYGPHEYHKGRMASVIFHTFHQIRKTRGMKLFRSHREGIADGHQSRDFISVIDVVSVIEWLHHHNEVTSGIYNLGTGTARTFMDLASATFKALKVDTQISFIDTPMDIREKYQYFTEASMQKLKGQGYKKEFTSLEDGISHYVDELLRYYGPISL